MKMEELKYCRACLVTDVKMYSLDITSNDSIGLIYSHLAQIRICDRNQHVCFECAYLLQKYQEFKSKCLRAHNILSSITVNSTEITKQIIQNIDRKENKLESRFAISPIDIYYDDPLKQSSNEVQENNEIDLKEDKKADNGELEIKTEIQVTDIYEKSNINHETSNGFETLSSAIDDRTKDISKISKELKTKKRKIKTEIQGIDEKSNPNESLDEFDDNDFIETSEEISLPEPISKRKTGIKKVARHKKRKIKTIANSDDNLSDDEPLSKSVAKTALKLRSSTIKKNGVNIEFFDDYATVVFLTHEEAKKELLSRKESSNYKRSPYKCDYCFKGYEAKAAYENHMKKHSIEYGDYECDLCHLRFPNNTPLSKHKLACHKRKFSCKLCPYVCYCMYQARTHVSLHKGKKYPCKDCGEIFSMPNSLLMHKRVKHLNESVPECVCDICGNTFGSPRGLFLHNMKLHRTDKNSKQGPKCNECGVHFSTEVAWKRHLVLSSRHKVINGCKYCGERFSNIEELKSHKRTQHTRVKQSAKRYDKKLPAACTVCNKWLSSHEEYKDHVITEHPSSEEAKKLNTHDPSPFVCEVCGQTFKQQCFLTYHQRKHTGERPYKCGECDKRFHLAGGLALHRAVHQRARTHACRLCNRLFSFKSALNKHMKIHLGIRPHKCTICDKGFIHMCDLKLHIKYVHDKVPWPKKKSKRNIADDGAPYSDYN